MIQVLHIYTDGSCNNRKNTKGSEEGGIGIVMRCETSDGNIYEKEHFEGCYVGTTSARMEIMGVVRALELINLGKWIIHIYCDNKYVIDTANGLLDSWIERGVLETKKNIGLWKRFIRARNRLKDCKIHYHWVRGHNGHEFNERCDRLANKGRLYKVKIKDRRVNGEK